jgi:uncharacterized protein YbaP (TraB family)
MISLSKTMRAGLSAMALALNACAIAEDAATTPAAPVQGPALWKVADEDTTIYLFGTVHALPKDVEWFRGPIAAALASAQVLVTEIPPGALKQPEVQQAFLARAMLPEGQTLRALLTAEQRTTVEGALAKLGLPAAAFDKVEPWFAAITLATMPMLKAGYSMEAGVENAVEAKLGEGAKREALETVEAQLALFDEMPMDVQIAYLVSVAEQMDKVVPSMDAMVAAWARGDADGLAKLMNEELDDPVLAERLLYARNRNWAEWVEARLANPGTVFVAVGAGHLAGANSVQDYLGKEGVTVTRVQ